MLALSAVSLYAQTNRGAISGTVSDQTQAVVSGATVTITNAGNQRGPEADYLPVGRLQRFGPGAGGLQGGSGSRGLQ
jgi:hypothetical protein